MGTVASNKVDYETDKIINVRRKTEIWSDDGRQKSCTELVIYTLGSFMKFEIDDTRLPPDIETNWRNYHLCRRRFEIDKRQSNTGLTTVWFQAVTGSPTASKASILTD